MLKFYLMDFKDRLMDTGMQIRQAEAERAKKLAVEKKPPEKIPQEEDSQRGRLERIASNKLIPYLNKVNEVVLFGKGDIKVHNEIPDSDEDVSGSNDAYLHVRLQGEYGAWLDMVSSLGGTTYFGLSLKMNKDGDVRLLGGAKEEESDDLVVSIDDPDFKSKIEDALISLVKSGECTYT